MGSPGPASFRQVLHLYYEKVTGRPGPASVRHTYYICTTNWLRAAALAVARLPATVLTSSRQEDEVEEEEIVDEGLADS
jgi:hypothetical protein